MAEKSAEASPQGSCSTPQDEKLSNNWWDSWLSSAKSKSAEVYTMVRKDLDEIGSAVKSEASHVFNSTSTAVSKTFKLDVPESPANVMKKSLTTFIGQVSTVLNPEPDDEDDTEVILSSGDTTMLSTYKKELEKIQRLDATFIVPPLEAEFGAWYSSLEATESGVISVSAASKRLEASPLLSAQYKKLVPDAVTSDLFWERYLFRVALLQDRLAAASRKQPNESPPTDPVLAHLPLDSETPSPIQQSPKKVLSGVESDQSDFNEETVPELDETDVAWEDEDFPEVELTEEQQTLLLEEYQKEIESKRQFIISRDMLNNNTKTSTTNIDNVKSETKAAQTIDKMDNKKEEKSNAKSPKKALKETVGNKNKTPKKSSKADVCGNNLVEDYFADKEVKDEADANSDESWEKEFEIEDVEQKV